MRQCERLKRAMKLALVGYEDHNLYKFHFARIERLETCDLPYDEWLALLESFKQDAVQLSQRAGNLKRLDAIIHGIGSKQYAASKRNSDMDKAAAKVWLEYYKEIVNRHAIA